MSEKFTHNGYTVRIEHDQDCENPRENDNAGVLVCFHRRYNLGDKDHGYREGEFSGWAWLRAKIELDHRPAVILPLGLIDHSGISLYVGSGANQFDPGGWDSGQVGFAYVSRATALTEWGGKIMSKNVRAKAEACLRAEIEEYDLYLRGECYGYVIETPDGEHVDSCWGFIGYEYAKEEALRCVPEEPAPVGGESEDEAHEETMVG